MIKKYFTKQDLEIQLFIRLLAYSILFIFCLKFLRSDYWFWNVKVGEYIFKNGMIDNLILCWSTKAEWIKHEWLFDLLAYIVDQINHNLSTIIYLLTSILTIFICYLYNKFQNFNITKEYIIIFEIIGYCYFEIMRPQIFDILLIQFTIIIYEISLKYKKYFKLIYLLPFIQLFWVNFHMETIIINICINLIYLLSNSFDLEIGNIKFNKASKFWLKISYITFACTLTSSLINPYGIKAFIYCFENMKDKIMLGLISEWHCPDIKDLGIFIFYFIPIAYLIISFIIYEKKIKASDILIYFLFVFLFLRSVRFANFLSIISIMIGYKYSFDLILFVKNKFNIKAKYKKVPIYYSYFIVILFIILSIFTVKTDNIILDKNHENQMICSKEIIKEIKDSNVKRIYNSYDIGGFLIYNDIEPFVYQCYTPFIGTKVYNSLISYEYCYDKTIDDYIKDFESYNFDSAIVKKNCNIVILDYLNKNFKLKSEDDDYYFYIKE